MNAEQVSAYVEAHKPVVLGTAAAGVLGLALLQRKKKAATPAAAGGPVTVQPTGTIPAAAVVPSQQTASTYDSSAYDVYNALSGQLEQLRQTTGGGSTPVTAPTPVASSLFAPNRTGQYVSYRAPGASSNAIYEVESDGSLYNLGMADWTSIIADNGGKEPAATHYDATPPTSYTGAANLQSKINKAAGVS